MNEKTKLILRELLLERFGMDIAEAEVYFSTQNYAFVFGESMIRVGPKAYRTRQDILSELMWIDDLKQFKQTICEPDRSLEGNLLEEFEIDGTTYAASLFRTARGKLRLVNEMTPMYFICVGDLLGSIHSVSTEERELGMNYKRKSISDNMAVLKQYTYKNLSGEIREKIDAVEARMNSLPRNLGKYGLCHGDFHSKNFFTEENNIWLFDFADCCYSDYMYDVATFVLDCLSYSFNPGVDRRQTLEEDILPWFKIGYELNKECGDGYWDDLELFLDVRAAILLMALNGLITIGDAKRNEQAKQIFTAMLLADDSLDALTKLLAKWHSGNGAN